MTQTKYEEGLRVIDEIKRWVPRDVRSPLNAYREYYIRENKPQEKSKTKKHK